MEILIGQDRKAELSVRFDILHKMSVEYMKCHSKCQLLIQPDLDFVDSTDSIDKKCQLSNERLKRHCIIYLESWLLITRKLGKLKQLR